jgi:uncharacterized protein YgiM (DUF1202 family)
MNRRYGEKERNQILKWASYIIFAIIVLWLLASIIIKKSPIDLLSSTFSKIPSPTSNSMQEELMQKDSIINELKLRLEAYEGKGNYGRALVIIDSETLNMRSGPSLTSEIVTKIPANSEVEILFYDTQTYYLNSLPGKWARIKYAGQEGWVWGNFIREI